MKWARLIALIGALVGIVAALAIPFLPVTQAQSTLSWPQDGTSASVTAPLVSYAPVELDITIPCAVAGAAEGRTIVSTSPQGAPDAERYGLVARVTSASDDRPATLEVIARNTMLVSAPVDELAPGCTVTVDSTPLAPSPPSPARAARTPSRCSSATSVPSWSVCSPG